MSKFKKEDDMIFKVKIILMHETKVLVVISRQRECVKHIKRYEQGGINDHKKYLKTQLNTFMLFKRFI